MSRPVLLRHLIVGLSESARYLWFDDLDAFSDGMRRIDGAAEQEKNL
jgi:hypothetical protein